MPILPINSAQFNEVIKSETPIFIKIFADFCGPCKLLKPVVETIAEKNIGIAFLEVDVEKNPEVPTQLHLSTVPVLLMYKNSKELGRLNGFNDEQKIQEFINTNIHK